MPYIKKEIQKSSVALPSFGTCDELSTKVDQLIAHIKTFDIEDREEICNYAISRIVAGSLKPSAGWKYKNLNRAYGTFFSAASEFYRRLMENHEDRAIEKYGDILEYENK